MIHKDDDCGSEEFDRTESFKYIHHLEGHSHALEPKYDAINQLEDGTVTDDENYAESEHEGWTGNEGAPAQYWYRTGRVLIVPPSRKVDFSLDTDERNFPAALKLMKECRARQPARNSYEAQQLNRFLILSINKSDSTGFGYSRYSYPWMLGDEKDDRERMCMEEIARIALERDWYYVYDSLLAK